MAVRKHAIYKHLPNPPQDAANASCYITGNGGSGVDTGALIYQEGTLFISDGALRELCEVAGFSFNAEALKLEEEHAFLTRENEELRTKLAELEADLDAVSRAMARTRKS